MRVRVLLASSCVLASLLPACSKDEPAAAPKLPTAKHLLLITVDTLRADRLHCYGGRDGASPAIDKLAAEGVRFTDCHAPMGMTLACLTTLMTSKYPDETAVTNNTLKLDPGENTLAERLTAAGFRSRGFVTNGVLAHNRSGIDQGFTGGYEPNDNESYIATKVRGILENDFGKVPNQREFMWVHFMNPHQPYDPPPKYMKLFDPNYEGKIDTKPETIDGIFVNKTKLAQRDLDHILAIWDGQVRFVSDLVGSLMDTLAKAGLDKDTLVVFTADHGEDLYDHNAYFYHANSLYRSVTHVPLILRQTGAIPAGTTHDDLIELVDVMPTILARMDVPVALDENPGTLPRGIDLSPAIFGTGRLDRLPFAFSQLESETYGVRNKNWFYVDNPNDYMPVSVPKEGKYPIARRELYDCKADPREQTNVVTQREDVAKNMLEQLNRWKAGLKKGTKLAQTMTKQDLEDLEKLGYVGGGK